jgi:hypothetical protein
MYSVYKFYIEASKLLCFTSSGRSGSDRSTTSTSASASSSFGCWPLRLSLGCSLPLRYSLSLGYSLPSHYPFFLFLLTLLATSPPTLLLPRTSLLRRLTLSNKSRKLFIFPHPRSLLIPPFLELLLCLDFLQTPCRCSFLDDVFFILLLLQDFL